jgi:dephospho-CoA kinase
MSKIIGLTGGIGSGKSTIANYFQSLGIPVYIADDQAKKVSASAEIIKSIKNVFGSEVFLNNKLDRKKLANIVFQNPDKLKALNRIIHPAVKKDFDHWLSVHKNFPIVIKEAAILFESGSYKYCDAIITVAAPLETRIERVILRDKTSRSDIISRINNQWTDEQRIEKSDFVIQNLSIDIAKEQVNEILKFLTNQ